MKKFALLYLFFLLLVLQIYLLIPSNSALALSNRCQTTDRQACLTTEILAITNKNPNQLIPLFKEFARLLKNGTLTDDPRIFSPIIHEVGMELTFNQIPIAQAFELCPLNFKVGCLHGAVMEAVDPLATVDFSFCDFAEPKLTYYYNCIHGLGHELAAKNTGDLNEILALCELSDSKSNHACLTGVFMEFSTGMHGTGQHTHEPPAGSILLPCDEVDPIYKSACYSSLSSYRQYSPYSEPFTETAATCLSAPTEYQSACMLGLTEKIFTAAAENIAIAELTCKSLDSSQVEMCKNSLNQINELESVL